MNKQIDARRNTSNPLRLRAAENNGASDMTFADQDQNVLNLMRWRRNYQPGDKVTKNEVVNDDSWLMVSNKTTDDTAAPTPQGDPVRVYPTDPTWTVNNHGGHVYSVMEITAPTEGLYRLAELRVWVQGITADDHYQVLVQDANGVFEEALSFDGDILTSPGFLTIPWRSDLLRPGGSSRVWLHQWNSSSASSQTFQWTRNPNSNSTADPGPGNWATRNNGATVRINDLDNGGVDRSAVITDTGLIGSVLRIQQANDANKWTEFSISEIADNAGWVVYTTSRLGSGPTGDPDVGALCDITFQVPVTATTAYVTLAGHLGQFSSLQSYIALDSPSLGAPSQDGVGIDAVFQPYYLSPDWDVMAYSGG